MNGSHVYCTTMPDRAQALPIVIWIVLNHRLTHRSTSLPNHLFIKIGLLHDSMLIMEVLLMPPLTITLNATFSLCTRCNCNVSDAPYNYISWHNRIRLLLIKMKMTAALLLLLSSSMKEATATSTRENLEHMRATFNNIESAQSPPSFAFRTAWFLERNANCIGSRR